MTIRQSLGCVLLLAMQGAAATFADFALAINHITTPENNTLIFRGHTGFHGRVHLNGQAVVAPGNYPSFHGFYTQTAESVINLPEAFYPQVFPEGHEFPYTGLVFPDTQLLLESLESVDSEHRYPALSVDGLQLTTWIQFDRGVYHVSQFAQEEVQGTDTTYAMDWRTRLLPRDPKLIWVEGVTRVQGIVSGQVTLASSDSLFLVGDVITADVNLDDCEDPNSFGIVPEGSPNRIGLIGLRDVIIAATVPNGLGNSQEDNACDTPYEAVVTACGQEYKDIVITAAILAQGCTFEAEYWKTTAFECTIPPQSAQSHCNGQNNTHVEIFSCGNSATEDRRGTIWLYGSLAVETAGFTRRAPLGPWGTALIGYDEYHRRHDPNLLVLAPPLWPEVEWLPLPGPGFSFSPAAMEHCGRIEDPIEFRAQWNNDSIYVEIDHDIELDHPWQEFTIRTWFNGVLEDAQSASLYHGNSAQYWPRTEIPDHISEVYMDVQWQDSTWNENGVFCQWLLPLTEVEEPDSASPTALALSAAPNPFNPATRIRFTLPRAEKVQLDVYNLQGQLVRRLQEGELAAGEHAVVFDGSDLSSGVYIAQLQTDSGSRRQKLVLLR